MTESTRLSLMEHFAEVPDPRVARTQRHGLLDIFAMALCAVIGGADHWTEVCRICPGQTIVVRHFFETAQRHPLP